MNFSYFPKLHLKRKLSVTVGPSETRFLEGSEARTLRTLHGRMIWPPLGPILLEKPIEYQHRPNRPKTAPTPPQDAPKTPSDTPNLSLRSPKAAPQAQDPLGHTQSFAPISQSRAAGLEYVVPRTHLPFSRSDRPKPRRRPRVRSSPPQRSFQRSFNSWGAAGDPPQASSIRPLPVDRPC